MIKKVVVLSLVAVMFAFFGAVNSSFAHTFRVYMVDHEGSPPAPPVDTFGWNETPWLFTHVPKGVTFVSASWWQDPGTQYSFDGSAYYFEDQNPAGLTGQFIWISLDQTSGGLDWIDIRQGGTWTADVETNNIYGFTFGEEQRSTNFTVTPEPVSAALFLIGGISLAAARRRRQKLAA